MKIAVIGTGYVGLVTGTCFAETGNQVTCIDVDEGKINSLRDGELTIYEPGLETIFFRNQKQGRLTFENSLKNGIEEAEVIFLALPTPSDENGSADLRHVIEVANELGDLIRNYVVVVDKSTVPVGTAEKVSNEISKKCQIEFDVVSNPEFLREGVAIDDFMKPDRVIIGSSSEKAMEIMGRLYAPMVRQGNPIIFMDERSAELTKYAANSFLATKITFMNEIANICEKLGADVDMVRKGIGSDSRIGKRFLFPGVGYGGSCFPKDVLALNKSAMENDYNFSILNAVLQTNAKQKEKLISKASVYYNGNFKGKTFAFWGLAFKPNTDDIREASALHNLRKLIEMGAKIKVYDPEAMENVKKVMGDKIEYCNNEYEALEDSEALFIFTEWSIFRNPDFDLIREKLVKPVIFDGRNLYDLQTMQSMAFNFFSIGRADIING